MKRKKTMQIGIKIDETTRRRLKETSSAMSNGIGNYFLPFSDFASFNTRSRDSDHVSSIADSKSSWLIHTSGNVMLRFFSKKSRAASSAERASSAGGMPVKLSNILSLSLRVSSMRTPTIRFFFLPFFTFRTMRKILTKLNNFLDKPCLT